jgi:hypothetical protein
MSETLDPLSDRACRMTHAYRTGIELRETLRDGVCLRAAVSEVTLYMNHLDDGYPGWHPAPDSFQGMLRLLIYREITGDSYRTLERHQELAEPFGVDRKRGLTGCECTRLLTNISDRDILLPAGLGGHA